MTSDRPVDRLDESRRVVNRQAVFLLGTYVQDGYADSRWDDSLDDLCHAIEHYRATTMWFRSIVRSPANKDTP